MDISNGLQHWYMQTDPGRDIDVDDRQHLPIVEVTTAKYTVPHTLQYLNNNLMARPVMTDFPPTASNLELQLECGYTTMMECITATSSI
jgi:hypothetical protein